MTYYPRVNGRRAITNVWKAVYPLFLIKLVINFRISMLEMISGHEHD